MRDPREGLRRFTGQEQQQALAPGNRGVRSEERMMGVGTEFAALFVAYGERGVCATNNHLLQTFIEQPEWRGFFSAALLRNQLLRPVCGQARSH